MANKWHVEVKAFDGTYRPQIWHEEFEPTTEKFNGQKQDIRNVRLIEGDGPIGGRSKPVFRSERSQAA